MKFGRLYTLVIVLFFTVCSYSQVAVIANKSVGESSITAGKAGEIYSLKVKTWGNGTGIVRYTLKSESETTAKFFGAIGKSSADMKKLWMKLQLTGEGQAPEALASEDEVINKVASTPGAIGFVSASKVNDKVKVLLTIN
jgi:ABC-type phosphate transport system substrate-binding protein